MAVHAETITEKGVASLFGLNRLREELFEWRETFSALLSANAGRIETLDNQIAALGPIPEDGEEAAEITARRDVLMASRQRLATPDALVAEAHARATGLLGEVDAQIRAKSNRRLQERGRSPLNPIYWADAISELGSSIEHITADAAAEIVVDAESGALLHDIPGALFYFGVAAVLLLRGRIWAAQLQAHALDRTARGRAIVSFVLSLGQIILPLVGLYALIAGLQLLDIWASRADPLLSAIRIAGTVVIVARWLNTKLFPPGDGYGPLSYAHDVRGKIRRSGILLSVAIAALVLIEALLALRETSSISVAVIMFPMNVLAAWALYRLGNLLRQPPVVQPGYTGSGGTVRRLVGQLTMFTAVLTPLLAATGYDAASDALFTPVVWTLVLFGVALVLMRLVNDIYAPKTSDTEDDTGSLVPVLVGFFLFIASLPILAIAWGASRSDLREFWSRISEGFAVGETRISPTDFFTFLLVFVVGYLVTQFVKTTLRSSVMPRTRLDLGGQNAVVAGVGYVGIFVSAMIAITSAGIDLTSLAFVAGALSLGIGFGLQNIVQNFVSGIILLIERPIGEGDMIEVNGQVGFVKTISVRSTRIETFDRTDVIIPNADLVSGQVTNWTRGNLAGRLILSIGVAYGSDVEAVKEILLDVAEKHPMVLLDPPPQVFFMNFGASSLDFEIRVILRDVNWKIVTLSEMNFEIDARFKEAGIEVPFPQQDVWLRNADGEATEEAKE